jgi:hypothetical protein
MFRLTFFGALEKYNKYARDSWLNQDSQVRNKVNNFRGTSSYQRIKSAH